MKIFHAASLIAGILIMVPTWTSAKPGTTQPCELLTETLVRKHLEVPAEIGITQDDNSTSRFPNCGYRWRIMSEAEEQAARDANTAKLMENVKAGRSPNEGINHSVRTHAEVRLTVAEFDDPEKAQNGLEGARSFMIGRDKQRDREPTPWDPVEGVGSKAYYHGTQLSFTWDRILIHLDVSPQELAEALAQEIMK